MDEHETTSHRGLLGSSIDRHTFLRGAARAGVAGVAATALPSHACARGIHPEPGLLESVWRRRRRAYGADGSGLRQGASRYPGEGHDPGLGCPLLHQADDLDGRGKGTGCRHPAHEPHAGVRAGRFADATHAGHAGHPTASRRATISPISGKRASTTASSSPSRSTRIRS